MARIYIAVGGNLGDPLQTVRDAIQTLQNHSALTAVTASSCYRSKPMGPQDQPDYVNAVVAADTELSPIEVLDTLQAIEQEFGRQRQRRWGERTLDLDLLLYANLIYQDARLTLPHPGLEVRDFVVIPLYELTPTLTLPNGKRLQDCLASVADHDLQKIN